MSYPAPPPAASAPQPASSAQPPAPSAGSFFNDLFDIRFTRFVSLRLISIVYILILALATVIALGVIFAGFAQGAGTGIFTLIVAALLWIVYVVLARVGLEAFAVLFRIHDDTSRVAEALAGARPAPAAPGTAGMGSVSSYDPGSDRTQTYPAGGYGAPTPPAPGTPHGTGNPSHDPAAPPWT